MATTPDSLVQEANDAYADAKKLADDALLEANQALDDSSAATAGLRVDWYVQGDNPTDVIPNTISAPTIPTSDFSADVKTAFDYAFGTLNDSLKPQIVNYLEAFFPDIADAVKTGSDQWIIDTIANGRFVPIDVENALWNRAKDREVQEALRNEASVIEASAMRGFTAPPGALNAAVAANQQELSKKLTTINRDIAIKAFDTANENTKFAIEQAVRLRTAFVAALGDFIKVAMVQPNQAVEYSKTILAAKTGLYDSAVSLYRADIEKERMRTSVLLENIDKDQKNIDQFITGRTATTDEAIKIASLRADAALKAAEMLSKVAAAAMATRNSMISVSAGV